MMFRFVEIKLLMLAWRGMHNFCIKIHVFIVNRIGQVVIQKHLIFLLH